jgi:hypothetical protein
MKDQVRDHAGNLDKPPLNGQVTCEEFQSRMPDMLGEDEIRNHEHLETCARCRALLEELEYIASIASDLLLPVYEPGDHVLDNIRASLKPGPDGVAVPLPREEPA